MLSAKTPQEVRPGRRQSERNGKVIKRYRSVQNERRRLTKDEPRFDLELSAFLGRTYNLKAIADYETGLGSEVTVP